METNSIAKLRQDMRVVVTDIEELLKATAGQTGERIEKVRARAEESLRTAREGLRQGAYAVNDQIQAHPWAATGIAAGTGLLLGLLIGRRVD